jgi:hypothetical protein
MEVPLNLEFMYATSNAAVNRIGAMGFESLVRGNWPQLDRVSLSKKCLIKPLTI